MNQVIEIPDTPDRLLATKHNKDRNKQPIPTKISIICNGIKRLISIPTRCNKSPLLTYFRETKPTIDNDRHDKAKALANTEVQKSSHKVNGHVQSEKGVLPLANLPAIVSLDGSGKSSKVENIPENGPTFDSAKGVDVHADNNTQPCTINKVYRRRKLVQNKCVPPLDIEKIKKVMVKCENGSVMKEVTSGSATRSLISTILDPPLDATVPEPLVTSFMTLPFSHFTTTFLNFSIPNGGKSSKVENIPENGPTFDWGKGVDVHAHDNTQPCDGEVENGSVMKEVTSGSGTVASNGGSSIVDIKDLVAEDNDTPKTSSRMCYQPNENESGINTQTESSTSINRGKRVRDIPDAEENDYEMFLALDEDNYKHQGATRAEINSLLVSTVQCVDEWLSRRRSCPVCKTSVDVIG
nr:hypothetical protein [Tanacetum cinerariifolium]